jgi:phage terminase large subunit-like protein
VLGDVSGRHTPDRWARLALELLDRHQGDYIVAEANNGGEMVAHTLHTVDPRARVKLVHASRGKQVRAEPCAAAYEHGDVSHVGSFGKLEDQLCGWEPGQGMSPDRLDALVWGWTELFPRTGFSAAAAIAAMSAPQ